MKTAEPKATTNYQPSQARNEGSQHLPFFGRLGTDEATLAQGEPFFSSRDGKTIQLPPFFGSRSIVQPKLRIGQPGDRYEQEADRKADRVVQHLAEGKGRKGTKFAGMLGIQRKPAFESEDELQKMEEPGEEEVLQRKPIFESGARPGEDEVQRQGSPEGERGSITASGFTTESVLAISRVSEKVQRGDNNVVPGVFPSLNTGDFESAAGDQLESRLDARRGGGQPLPRDTQEEMEGGLGANFGDVRIHDDAEAVSMSDGLGAQAFTQGSDIYFNQNRYDPQSTDGKRLLAHELTHTVQQGASQEHGREPQSLQRKPQSQVPGKVVQRGLVDDFAKRFLSDNEVANFLVGVIAGIVEWFVDIVSAIVDLFRAAFIERNIAAIVAVAGIIIVFILAVAFPEIVLPILVVLGAIVGAGFLLYHLWRVFFATGLTPYERGKEFGKAIVEAILLIFTVAEIIRFVKTYGQVARLASGVGLMQQLRWVRALGRYGDIAKVLELLASVGDVERTVQLLEITQSAEVALELLRLTGNAEHLLSLLRHAKVANVAQLFEMLRVTKVANGAELLEMLHEVKVASGAELLELLREAKVASGAELLEMLRSAKAADGVQLLELLREAKVASGAELLEMLRSAKVASGAELLEMLRSAKVANGAELLEMLHEVKVASGAELLELLREAKVASGAELLEMLRSAKVANGAQLLELLREAKLSNGAQLLDLLRNAKVADGAQLLELLREAKLADGAQLLELLHEAKLTDGTQLLALLRNTKIADAAQLQDLLRNTKLVDATQLDHLLAHASVTDATQLKNMLDYIGDATDLDRFLAAGNPIWEGQAVVARAEASQAANYAAANGGAAQPGYVGNRPYGNNGHTPNDMILPRKDAAGNLINYREYDIHRYTKGVNRGAERIVIGSDGRKYYTGDHYRSFSLF